MVDWLAVSSSTTHCSYPEVLVNKFQFISESNEEKKKGEASGDIQDSHSGCLKVWKIGEKSQSFVTQLNSRRSGLICPRLEEEEEEDPVK